MRHRVPWLAFVGCLSVGAAYSRAAVTKDASYNAPNKAYVLTIHRDDETSNISSRILDTKTKKVVWSRDDEGILGETNAVWAPDSSRVALYIDPKRGGLTTALELQGDHARELSIPEIRVPAEKDSKRKAIRWPFYSVEPLRWEKSGNLLLNCNGRFQAEARTGDEVPQWIDFRYTTTVAFDKEYAGKVINTERHELKTVTE